MVTMLVLNIPPELDEDLVDYLLECSDVSGFTSYEARGHGEHEGMSIAEQVSGRRKRLQFEIMLKQEAIETLLGGLKENVGKGIIYWQQQLSNIGRV